MSAPSSIGTSVSAFLPRTAEAFRDDAATIAYGPGPHLESAQSVTILAAALRPPKSGPPVRLPTVRPGRGPGHGAPGRRHGDPPPLERPDRRRRLAKSQQSVEPIARDEPPVVCSRWSDAATARRYPAPGRITDRRVDPGARQRTDLGTLIRMVPGAAGNLYVSIPATDGTVLGRLDATGAPAPGWPVFLPGSELCDQLLPVASGSVRLLCHRPAADEGLGGMITRVHAFNSNGQALPGWPIEIKDVVTGRMVQDDLTLIVKPYVGDVAEPDTPEPVFIVVIDAAGTARKGAEVPIACCEQAWAIGPDGVAYGTFATSTTQPPWTWLR